MRYGAKTKGEQVIAIASLAFCGAVMADLVIHGRHAEDVCRTRQAQFAAAGKQFGNMPVETKISAKETGYFFPFISTSCKLNPR